MASCCTLHKHSVGVMCTSVAISSSSLTLLTQIEFYFGDANLPKDKFLQQKISENPDGCKHVASSQLGLPTVHLQYAKQRGKAWFISSHE